MLKKETMLFCLLRLLEEYIVLRVAHEHENILCEE